MKRTRNRDGYLKYIAIAFVIVFFIAAILLLIELWERKQGNFQPTGTFSSKVEYKGKKYEQKENVETFLVLGLDKFEETSSADSQESGTRTDFLMLLVFDNDAKKCSAVHINRDTMATVNRLGIGAVKTDSFTKQIALAYSYVADDNDRVRCVNTVESVKILLHGAVVNHYMAMTMDAVSLLNDLVGGVEVTVLNDFTGIDDSLVKGETVKLKGEQALRYVRTRYGLEDSTNSARMARQQQYMKALYQKTMSCMESDDSFIINMIDTIDEYLVYDSSDQRMKEFAERFNQYEFLGIREIEGETKVGEEFIEFYPNEDSVMEIVMDLFYTVKTDNDK